MQRFTNTLQICPTPTYRTFYELAHFKKLLKNNKNTKFPNYETNGKKYIFIITVLVYSLNVSSLVWISIVKMINVH